MPIRLDFVAVRETDALAAEIERQAEDCLLDLSLTKFIDSTGVGWLIRVKKRLRAKGKELVLVSPTRGVKRALGLMRLTDFFFIASDENAACELLSECKQVQGDLGPAGKSASTLCWSGEVTAANAEAVWADTRKYLVGLNPDGTKTIDLSRVRFIDSTGLGLLVRSRKLSLARAETLTFIGLQPAVLNVLRLSRLEAYLLKPPISKPAELLTPPTQDTCESAFPP